MSPPWWDDAVVYVMALNLDEEPLRLPAGTVVLATHPGTVAAHGSPRGRRRGALT